MKKTCSVFATRWGYVAAVWSESGLWELTFPHPTADEALTSLHHAADAVPGDSPWAAALGQELERYFAGEKLDFTVPIDWSGYTSFQATVLRYNATIAYGAVASYGQVAAAIGSPKASRAVGEALHINRTPVVVPCHRVVGADGRMVGFGGGIPRKEALLQLEQEGR